MVQWRPETRSETVDSDPVLYLGHEGSSSRTNTLRLMSVLRKQTPN